MSGPDELPAPGAAPAAAPEPAAPVPAAADTVSSGPGAGPADAAAAVVTGAPAPSADQPASGGPAQPPTKEFAPSLLDEAAKTPTAEPSKPDASQDAKPADGQPPAAKEPAAADAKPGDKASTEAQPAEAKPAEPPAPIEYAFTLANEKGERVPVAADQIDPERMGAFTGILQEARVAPEAAQKMIDMHVAEVARAVDMRDQRQWDVFANTQKEWRDAVMADPELGGSRHATATKTVMGLIDAFNSRPGPDGKARSAEAVAAERKDLLDVARITGVANNPTWLRLLHWAGDKYVREPQARPAPPPRAPAQNPATRGLRRYQNTTPAAS